MEGNIVEALACEFEYLKLSCVMFCRGDNFGKLMALASLIPHAEFLCLISASLFAPKNIQVPIWKVVILLVIGDRLNAVLKNVIQSDRPMSDLLVYGQYGMPSAHAQFQSTLSVSTVRLILSNQHTSKVRKSFLYTLSVTLFLSIILVGISRIYHPYHTFLQVTLGGVLGLFLGWNVENPVLDRLADATISCYESVKRNFVFE